MGDRTWVRISVYEGDTDQYNEIFNAGDAEQPDISEWHFDTYDIEDANGGASDEYTLLAGRGGTFYGNHGPCSGAYGPYCFASFHGFLADVTASEEGEPTVPFPKNGLYEPSIEQAKKYWDIMRLIELWKKTGCKTVKPETEDDKRILAAYAAWKMGKGAKA